MRWQESRISALVEESRSDAPPLSPKELKEAAAKAGAKIDEASANWRQRRAKASFDAYHAAKSLRGGCAQAQCEALEKPYRELVLSDLDWLFDSLSRGDVPLAEARSVIDGFSYDGFKEPEQRYKAELPRIEQRRVREAKSWVRVVLQFNNPAYEELVLKTIREKWSRRGGFKLVFGYTLSSLEDEATAKTLDFRITQHETVYESPYRDPGKGGTSVSIPDSVKVVFEVKGSDRVPTSWDKLAPVSASVELPNSVSVFGRSGATTAQTDKLIQEKEKELVSAFIAMLQAQLPPFAIFPGVDAGKLQLRAGKRLDREAAFALLYLDPERLKREATQLSQAGDRAVDTDLMLFAVAADLDYLSSWVVQKIPSAESSAQSELARELRLRPWYGDYAAAAALIQNASFFPGDAMQSLAGRFEPKVRDAVLKRIADPRGRDRANYASFFVQQAPMDDAARQAALWVKDKDSFLGVSAYVGLLNRDRKRAADLMFDEYDHVGPAVQEKMLQFFKYSPQEDGERGLRLLVKVSREKSPAGDNARAVLREASQTSAQGWEAYLYLAEAENDPGRKTEMERELIWKARYARSDKAEGFLRRKFTGPDAALRDAAIQEYLATDEAKADLLRDLARMAARSPADKQLLRQIILGIHQYHSIRRNWDFSEGQADLKTLLELGARHPDAQIRECSYAVMRYAIKQGAQHYAPALKAALADEKDERLKRTFGS